MTCSHCISSGQVVKAMILNCLGFLSAPLYLFSEFFASKPVSHLLGEGVEARHLNDDRLGRVLDELQGSGTTGIFLKAALQGVRRFGVKIKQVHVDSTSFSVDGEYASEGRKKEEEKEGEERKEGEEMKRIEMKRGYSRDHRPDLNNI
jgi:transposase